MTSHSSSVPAKVLSPELSDLAARLWAARQGGGTVDADAVPGPQSAAEAYGVQLEIIRLAGGDVAGFKVGSTSREAQMKLGTTEPGSCPVPAAFMLRSPAMFTGDAAHHPAVEGEFALRLGRDLPPRSADYTIDDVRAAVDGVAGAIELVGTRFAGGLTDKGRLLITADCSADMALVLGEVHAMAPGLDLRDHAVTMRIKGAAQGAGTGARALGDPFNVLAWLANQQSRWGRGLKQGEWVATGTCTGLDPVAPGDHAVADFGDLGVVELTLDRG